jgi:hypothetical protein
VSLLLSSGQEAYLRAHGVSLFIGLLLSMGYHRVQCDLAYSSEWSIGEHIYATLIVASLGFLGPID